MDPCSVCGGTDMNLVDGFYYCMECGTQDANVRETIVEQTMMGDGTFAHTTTRKFTTVDKDGIEMSNEWYKWHTFNFILAGLTDELIALGAKPSVKMKVLWIWSRYMKKFQVKDDSLLKNKLDIEDGDDKGMDKDENDEEESHSDDSDHELREKSKKAKSDKIIRHIKTITKGTLLTILYVALNLDRSDIQLSHLFRFIREGRLSLYEWMKYVPKELKINAVKNWKSFLLSQTEYNPLTIREMSMTCFKILELGVPLVPDMRKIARNCVQELCLPNDVKDLVFALMHYMPVDFLDIDTKIQKSLVRIPDYEGICMAYILVALKMIFGLDDDYELRISEEVDKINDDENFLKSYKLGMLSEPCDRLFSYKEWYQHLLFRKYILCKNYLPMSRQYNNETDDYVFMEHLEERRKRKIRLSDDVTVDILNKILVDQASQVIPKADFPVTLTPMSTYIDVIAQRVQDPDLRLLLCEDFTQYSLKYAVKDLTLPGYLNNKENPIVGVSKTGKTFNHNVIGTLNVQEGDMTMVYVRDCQNKNWLKTEPPKRHHVTKISHNENSSDIESDHGYDSNIEKSIHENDETQGIISDESVNNNDKKLEIIIDFDVDDKCIFDDNFIDIPMAPYDNGHITTKEERDSFFEIDTQSNFSTQDSKVNSLENIENCVEMESSSVQFELKSFYRDKIIKELIELACKKYKIVVPKEDIVDRKRKRNLVQDKASSSETKKQRAVKRSKPGEAKREVDNLISTYYINVHNDYLNKFSQQVKSIIDNMENSNILDTSNILENQKDKSDIRDSQTDINNSNVLNIGDEKSRREIDSHDRAEESDLAVIDSVEQNVDNETVEENVQDDIFDEIFPKNDPKYDEKDHDIRQLYIKLVENPDSANSLLSDIENNPVIDKIIEKNIEVYSNIDRNALESLGSNKINGIDDFSDSDDDVPLNILKETCFFEQEKMDRRKEKLQILIKDPSRVMAFKYWVRHYQSNYVVKSRDIGKKFDLELNENLPISFVFVIRECAAILGCSMFSLYKKMQNIEEILIANNKH